MFFDLEVTGAQTAVIPVLVEMNLSAAATTSASLLYLW